ncbi:MAG TPA: hypothetical protein VLJ42_00110 [Solirubrobacteraceae bacterium]|nr:hypothetical protein [Solirubrobacteraceae bacterium]
MLVTAKRLLDTRDVEATMGSLRRASQILGEREAVPLLSARYLAPSTRARIAEAGGAYVDATGNLSLKLDRPALFLRDAGAQHDPWRRPGRPRAGLQGAPAARVTRALIDFAAPYTVPQLAAQSGASVAAAYRVTEFAAREGLLTRERENRGAIVDVAWRRLLERWSQDYSFDTSNSVAAFLEPRGPGALLERLRQSQELVYAMTGSLAAHQLAPYAPARVAALYVKDIATAADRLELRRVDRGANVFLAAGKHDVVFDRAFDAAGVRYAAPSQIAVDLMSGSGRNPDEAATLLDWMERHEAEWRH